MVEFFLSSPSLVINKSVVDGILREVSRNKSTSNKDKEAAQMKLLKMQEDAYNNINIDVIFKSDYKTKGIIEEIDAAIQKLNEISGNVSNLSLVQGNERTNTLKSMIKENIDKLNKLKKETQEKLKKKETTTTLTAEQMSFISSYAFDLEQLYPGLGVEYDGETLSLENWGIKYAEAILKGDDNAADTLSMLMLTLYTSLNMKGDKEASQEIIEFLDSITEEFESYCAS